jgi:hypothetical protein
MWQHLSHSINLPQKKSLTLTPYSWAVCQLFSQTILIVLISYTNTSTSVLQSGSTVLPRQLHNSHPVQAMQYRITNSFTIHTLYKPRSTMLPTQLHNSHPVQVMQYHVTKITSQFTPCTSHALPYYQHSFTNHILYKPYSTMLPIQIHKSHPVQAMQYRVTKTASQFTSCASHAVVGRNTPNSSLQLYASVLFFHHIPYNCINAL